jgi:hypothetical protein
MKTDPHGQPYVSSYYKHEGGVTTDMTQSPSGATVMRRSVGIGLTQVIYKDSRGRMSAYVEKPFSGGGAFNVRAIQTSARSQPTFALFNTFSFQVGGQLMQFERPMPDYVYDPGFYTTLAVEPQATTYMDSQVFSADPNQPQQPLDPATQTAMDDQLKVIVVDMKTDGEIADGNAQPKLKEIPEALTDKHNLFVVDLTPVKAFLGADPETSDTCELSKGNLIWREDGQTADANGYVAVAVNLAPGNDSEGCRQGENVRIELIALQEMYSQMLVMANQGADTLAQKDPQLVASRQKSKKRSDLDSSRDKDDQAFKNVLNANNQLFQQDQHEIVQTGNYFPASADVSSPVLN